MTRYCHFIGSSYTLPGDKQMGCYLPDLLEEGLACKSSPIKGHLRGKSIAWYHLSMTIINYNNIM